MVSFSVSPLEELVVEASWNPITRPPRRLTAVSKLNRVRVEGSKTGWQPLCLPVAFGSDFPQTSWRYPEYEECPLWNIDR